jgi:hypothetical protein
LRSALADSEKAKPAPLAWLFGASDVESDTVVLDGDTNGVRVGGEHDASNPGARMTGNIGESFLHDAVHRALGFGWYAGIDTLVLEDHREVMAPPKFGQM